MAAWMRSGSTPQAGAKHHHGVDLGIGIEALDAGEDRGFVRILGDGVQMEPNAQLLGPGPLPLGIDFQRLHHPRSGWRQAELGGLFRPTWRRDPPEPGVLRPPEPVHQSCWPFHQSWAKGRLLADAVLCPDVHKSRPAPRFSWKHLHHRRPRPRRRS